jgi:hypothetical protein
MAIEAGHVFRSVRAQFKFMDDRVLEAGVAFGAFTRCSHKRHSGLTRFDLGPLRINEQRRQNEAKADNQCNEDGAE